ncbi:MAG: DUF2393 domain-containing protein [Helicobacteraceae bacterium]|jgi:hypothetical protein|nr:DUF2393 domain-containing protein [Helicobacteraceae bacterium]
MNEFLARLTESYERLLENPMVAEAIRISDNVLYSLTTYHLIGFAVIFAILLIIIILAVSVSHIAVLSLFLQFFALAFLIAAPIISYFFIEKTFKYVGVENLVIMNMYYQDVALVRGTAQNLSKNTLDGCQIKIKCYEPPKGTFDYFMKLATTKSVGLATISKPLNPGEITTFEAEIANVKYDDNLSLSASIRCR